MKSILALLVILSVAYAGILEGKEGGLKGSWSDELEVESASADTTAPGIAYYDDDSDIRVVELYWCSGDFDETGIYNSTDCGSDNYLTVNFKVTGEATSDVVNSYYDFESTGSIIAVYWTGEGDSLRTIDLACSVYYSSTNDVTCSGNIYQHQTPGVYKPSITLIDAFGNWATYDETAFETAGNNGVFTLQEEHPDTMPPTLATFAVSSTEGEIGTVADLDDDSVFVEFSVVAGDGYVGDGTDWDSATYDWRSSGINGVWVTVTDDATMEAMNFALSKGDEVGTDMGTYEYGTRITFYPTMNAGTWTINSVWAVDNAGNKFALPQTGVTYTLTQSDAGEEDVFSVQTFDFVDADVLDPTVPYTLSATEDTDIYFTAGVTVKNDANTNYLAATIRTPGYIPAGNTAEIRSVYWNRQAGNEPTGFVQVENFGYGVSWTQTILGADAGDASEPGVATSGTGALATATDYIAVFPMGQEGDYELADVFTITEFGTIQRYSIEFGSASSAAPSVFAVAVAAAVALLL